MDAQNSMSRADQITLVLDNCICDHMANKEESRRERKNVLKIKMATNFRDTEFVSSKNYIKPWSSVRASRTRRCHFRQ